MIDTNRLDLSINIPKVLLESWELVAGVKSQVAWLLFLQSLFNGLFYLIFLLFIVPKAMDLVSHLPTLSLDSLSGSSSLLSSAKQSSHQMSLELIRSLFFNPLFIVFALIFVVLTPFFIAAEYLMGIKQALDLKPTIGSVFADCVDALPQLLLIFFIFMFPWSLFYFFKPTPSWLDFGLLNLLFQGLFFLGCILTSWACFAFAVPLVIIKHYHPIRAILEAVSVVISYWWILIKLSMIMLFIFAASIFTLGIFLIWAIPMMLNMHGIIFRDIFRS